jgi:hypothetical protein
MLCRIGNLDAERGSPINSQVQRYINESIVYVYGVRSTRVQN